MISKYSKLIVYIELYLISTILLYFFGPLRYFYQNTLLLVFFLSIYHLVFILGYMFAIKFIRVQARKKVIRIKELNRQSLLLTSTIISVFFGIFELYDHFGTLNVVLIYNQFVLGLSNAGDLYHANLEFNSTFEGSLITQMTTLFSPLTYLVIPLGILEFKKIKNSMFKSLWIFSIITNLIVYLMTGTNIGVFRVIGSVVFTFYIVIQKEQRGDIGRENNEKKIKNNRVKILSIIIMIMFFIIFINNVTSRMPQIGLFLGNVLVDYDNVVLSSISDKYHSAIILITSYLAQGYNGMGLALGYKWIPLFPIGNSIFLINNSSILGINPQDILEKTYAYRMTAEWSPTVNWHTIYTWLANDVSFIGVILLMFLLGIYLGIIYKSALNGNAVATVMFSLLMLMIIFFPMNNVVLSNPLSFLPFIIYTTLFFTTYRVSIVKGGALISN